MARRFQHAALVGKYQADGIRPLLQEIAHFLVRQGLEVTLELQTAQSTGLTDYGAMAPDDLGRHCDLAVVVAVRVVVEQRQALHPGLLAQAQQRKHARFLLSKSAQDDWQAAVSTLADVAELRTLIENHHRYTGSAVAERVLADFTGYLGKFVKVMPTDYKRVLLEQAKKQQAQAAAGMN